MKIPVEIAGQKLTLLKSRMAWIVWRRQAGLDEKREVEPKSYPCLAYTYATYREDTAPGFIYPNDVEKMAKKLKGTNT